MLVIELILAVPQHQGGFAHTALPEQHHAAPRPAQPQPGAAPEEVDGGAGAGGAAGACGGQALQLQRPVRGPADPGAERRGPQRPVRGPGARCAGLQCLVLGIEGARRQPITYLPACHTD